MIECITLNDYFNGNNLLPQGNNHVVDLYNSVITYIAKQFLKKPVKRAFNPLTNEEFANNNYKFDENGGKFSKRIEKNTVGKGEIACYKPVSFCKVQCAIKCSGQTYVIKSISYHQPFL